MSLPSIPVGVQPGGQPCFVVGYAPQPQMNHGRRASSRAHGSPTRHWPDLNGLTWLQIHASQRQQAADSIRTSWIRQLPPGRASTRTTKPCSVSRQPGCRPGHRSMLRGCIRTHSYAPVVTCRGIRRVTASGGIYRGCRDITPRNCVFCSKFNIVSCR